MKLFDIYYQMFCVLWLQRLKNVMFCKVNKFVQKNIIFYIRGKLIWFDYWFMIYVVKFV